MSTTEQDTSQPIGLDVGTSRIVVARSADKKFRFETQLNAFITLPFSKLTQSLLVREDVFHEVQGDDLVVAGDDAQRFAEVFHVETRRPMFQGILNPQEPHALAVIRRIITKMLGRATTEGQKICFSVPTSPPQSEDALAFHQASIRQILKELGLRCHADRRGFSGGLR
jgi:actin-like ATPase involved in cell morphogenesis